MKVLENLELLKKELIKRGMSESIINVHERKSDEKVFMYINYSKQICVTYSNGYHLDMNKNKFLVTSSIDEAAEIIFKSAEKMNNGCIAKKWDNTAYVSYLDLSNEAKTSDWIFDKNCEDLIRKEVIKCVEKYCSGKEYAIIKAELKVKVEKIVPKNAISSEWDKAIEFAYNELYIACGNE